MGIQDTQRRAILSSSDPSVVNTGILYVDDGGLNSDGLTWSTAYTNPVTAFEAARAGNLILIGEGTYDINVTGDPTYATDMKIKGTGRHATILTNDHAAADTTLMFTGLVDISSLTVFTSATNDPGGIIISGANSIGSRLRDLHFEFDALGAGANALQLTGSTKYVRVEDCDFHGETTNTKAIHMSQCSQSFLQNIHISDANSAIHLDHTDDDDNHFSDVHFHACTTGVTVDAGAATNSFDKMHFHGTTTEVVDAGTSSSWTNVHSMGPLLVYPLNSTGTLITSKNVAHTFADSDVQIDNGTGFTANKPFRILGMYIGNPSDNAAVHVAEISQGVGGSETTIYRGSVYVEGKFAGSGGAAFDSGWLAPQTRIAGNLMTDNAVADTARFWIQYQEML